MDKKTILSWVLIAAGVAVVSFFISTQRNSTTEPNDTPGLESVSPTPTPTLTPISAQPTKTPAPTLIIDANDYKYWFDQLDEENKVLAVYDECSYLVPSNLTYNNHTDVMLDNTRSSEDHILKIGEKDYALKAGSWQIVTLSSSTGAIRWPIYCKGIELGEIEIK